MNTGRTYTDGSPIMVGDTIELHDGCKTTVFYHKRQFRVALIEHDLEFGLSCSLGLFIVGCEVKKVQ